MNVSKTCVRATTPELAKDQLFVVCVLLMFKQHVADVHVLFTPEIDILFWRDLVCAPMCFWRVSKAHVHLRTIAWHLNALRLQWSERQSQLLLLAKHCFYNDAGERSAPARCFGGVCL